MEGEFSTGCLRARNSRKKRHAFLRKVRGLRVIFGAKRHNLTGLRRTRPDATCIMLKGTTIRKVLNSKIGKFLHFCSLDLPGTQLRKCICAAGLKYQRPTLQHLLRYTIVSRANVLLKHPIHQIKPSEVSHRNVRNAHESMQSR